MSLNVRAGRLLPTVLLVVGIAVILLGGATGRYVQILSAPREAPLPASLAGRQLQASSYGVQAVAEIARLHGSDFPLTSAAVGSYGMSAEIRIWTAGTGIGWMARRMTLAMNEAISDGNSPFTPLGERMIEGRSVYELEGMGQRHYYFIAGPYLVWLAAESSVAPIALKEALEFYP
jgi:hypothetical protein